MVEWTRRAADLPSNIKVECILDPAIDKGYMGLCDRIRPDRFVIRVDARLSYWHVADVLIHEWAHARQFLLYGDETAEHGPEFGREFAFIYARWVLELDSSPMVGVPK